MRKAVPEYDIVVIGAGHAGCEAALAASRMGCRTLLMTMSFDAIAQLSCNPAIGGPGKGHIAREISALGGEMARAVDDAGIQFRMLNTTKGPAVWAPRAQIDKWRYHRYMRAVLEQQQLLDVLLAQVAAIMVRDQRVTGVKTVDGFSVHAAQVIVAAGTFLRGVIHVGPRSVAAGRLGEGAARQLADWFRKQGFSGGRLKTGTPARVHRDSIMYEAWEPQEGDETPQPFAYERDTLSVDQVRCYLGYTNENTHAIIRDNLNQSALYSGKISGTGVRYCPSIEDKIVKFPEKNSHQLFIEPEGRDSAELYINGLSNSLPYDVQRQVVYSIRGLEQARITRYAYGIEYDFIQPTQLWPTLETKRIQGLYLAGQIIGTTGYEEAAGQGLVAGINAACSIQRRPSCVLSRTNSYIGVLIDDLVTKGTQEPYRMFPSRVEHRLTVRQDNADLRLSECGYELGLISASRIDTIRAKQKTIAAVIAQLHQLSHANSSLAKVLKRPELHYEDIQRIDERVPAVSPDIRHQIETTIKYEGYIEREQALVARLARVDEQLIPPAIWSSDLTGLKKEAREKLLLIQPQSVGQARRISGITVNDLALLLVKIEHCERRALRQ